MAVDHSTLPIVELFKTYQGEGNQTGRLAIFIRTGNCNLHCTWCDSWYTWDDERGRAPETDMTPDEIVSQVRDLTTREDGTLPAPQEYPIIILTGGEPLMHQHRESFRQTLHELYEAGYSISVETNGTMIPRDDVALFIDHYSVSPKVFDQGDRESIRLKAQPLWFFARMARHCEGVFIDSGEYESLPALPVQSQVSDIIFKVVCRGRAEVEQVRAWADRLALPLSRVWIMPEGDTYDSMSQTALDIADTAMNLGLQFSYRVHVAIWGDERGR